MLFKTSSTRGGPRLIFADKPPNLMTEQRAERRNKVYFETMENRMPRNAIVSASGERSWLPKVYEQGENKDRSFTPRDGSPLKGLPDPLLYTLERAREKKRLFNNKMSYSLGNLEPFVPARPKYQDENKGTGCAIHGKEFNIHFYHGRPIDTKYEKSIMLDSDFDRI